MSTQKASLVANQDANYASEQDPYYYNYNPNQPSSGSAPPQGDFENAALKQRALELAKREEELMERERSLQKKEAEVTDAAPKPNWPRCYPVVYHSLTAIEGRLRRTVAIMGYIGFFVFTAIVILNFVAAMIAVSPFISYGNSDDMGNSGRAKFGIMSALFVLLAPIAHMAVSYAPLYKAMHTVHIFWFLILFITYALPILFCAFCFAGWYEYGPCGLILMIVSIPASGRGNLTVFITSCIMTALWALMGIYYLIIYIMVLQVFRRENHTFKSARDFLKGSLVRGVSKAVTTGVSQVVAAQMTGGNQEGSVNSV